MLKTNYFNPKHSKYEYPNNIFISMCYWNIDSMTEEEKMSNGIEYYNMAETQLNSDQLKGLEYVLSGLTDSEQVIMKERYQDKLSYDEIAVIHNLTRERIRQKVNKCLRKLKHPARYNYISLGYDVYENKKAEIRRQHNISDKINENTSIQDLGITDVKLHNCLMRKGFSNVKEILDIIDTNPESLYTIRNAGVKTIDKLYMFLYINGFITAETVNKNTNLNV